MPVIAFNAYQGFKRLKLWRKLGGGSIMITILRKRAPMLKGQII